MSKVLKKDQAVEGFDYGSLGIEQRLVVQQRAGEIRERLRRTAQDIWEVGQKLSDVRSRLKHGQFEAWLSVEFGWSRRTAYNFINVYEAFPERANFTQVDIAASALYLLAAPSTPQTLRDEFMHRACQGEKVTHSTLRKALQAAKQSPSSAASTIEVVKVAPEIPQATPIRPEIIAFIPKTEPVGKLKPVVVRTSEPKPVAIPSYAPPQVKLGDWYLLGKKHVLFCGDTAAAHFHERAPQADLAVAITDDWGHDWLIERANTLLLLPESPLKEGTIKQTLMLYSEPGDTIIFPWLPDKAMLAIAHQLDRRICAGDPSPERCSRAIACSGLKVERIHP
ncbi:MAG: DUF3102 domain-containing protein [Leptolyngbyaceae cyanobacterium MO_188.B28]|nr:DUF3102 domain-containing protein [Leptolyngbyaceae cyanobacterium MO_188.B28]